MNPMLEEEEALDMPAEDPELAELDLEALKEMMGFAKKGMSRDISARLAPPPPAEEAMPPEDPEIPGVEADGEADLLAAEGAGGEAKAAGPGVDKLKALLLSMKKG